MAIDWSRVPDFSPREFADSPDEHAQPALIYRLQTLRARLGAPIFPSPVPGALARFDGPPSSRHYAVGRLSDAVDVFPVDGMVVRAWQQAVALFGGVGLYLDTHFLGRSWPMLHVDLRPEPVWWVRDAGAYHYAHSSPSAMRRLLSALGNLA